jgi:hypothetical protein
MAKAAERLQEELRAAREETAAARQQHAAHLAGRPLQFSIFGLQRVARQRGAHAHILAHACRGLGMPRSVHCGWPAEMRVPTHVQTKDARHCDLSNKPLQLHVARLHTSHMYTRAPMLMYAHASTCVHAFNRCPPTRCWRADRLLHTRDDPQTAGKAHAVPAMCAVGCVLRSSSRAAKIACVRAWSSLPHHTMRAGAFARAPSLTCLMMP